MIEILKVFLQTTLSEHCYRILLIEKSYYENKQCLHQAALTGLGMLIMLLSIFLKIPQLLKIIKNGSGQGISMSSVYMELLALTSSASYAYANGYPFSSWGEGLFLSLQQLGLTVLLLYYCNSNQKLLLLVLCYATAITVVVCQVIPLNVFWFIKASVLPIMLSGKLMQCWANYINKGTGQLSCATCALTVVMCCCRLITSISLTRDTLLVLQFSLATLTNTLLLLQVLCYCNYDKLKQS